MRKLKYFSNREECKKYLKENFDFKYFIPYEDDKLLMSGQKRYYIEINESNKLNFCAVESVCDGLIYNTLPFYDFKRAYDFKLEEDGEAFHRYSKRLKEEVEQEMYEDLKDYL